MLSIVRAVVKTIIITAISIAVGWACTRAYHDSKPWVLRTWEKYFSNKMKGTREGIRNVGGRVVHQFRRGKDNTTPAVPNEG